MGREAYAGGDPVELCLARKFAWSAEREVTPGKLSGVGGYGPEHVLLERTTPAP